MKIIKRISNSGATIGVVYSLSTEAGPLLGNDLYINIAVAVSVFVVALAINLIAQYGIEKLNDLQYHKLHSLMR